MDDLLQTMLQEGVIRLLDVEKDRELPVLPAQCLSILASWGKQIWTVPESFRDPVKSNSQIPLHVYKASLG